VNDEFSALDSFLRIYPLVSTPGGAPHPDIPFGRRPPREESFEAGLRDGLYAEIAQEVIRPTLAERRDIRVPSAKLRWARR